MAATPVITCPECKKKFKGKEGLQGKKIRCPACSHAFIVEMMSEGKVDSSPAAAQAKEPAKAAAPKPSKAFLDEDEADENPYGVVTPDLAPRCPNCANELESADALICLYCGYNTQTRKTGKTKKVLALTGGEHFLWLLPGLSGALGIFLLYLANLIYCIALPGILEYDSWVQMFNHESMRLWISLISLAVIWVLGYYAHKRLIFEPKPPEQLKD
ncbi:MAG: zinc-ribbon domain-containing protein [Gemmataceae bacterium]|nr:zinc-ribbon domain-containing protein [Gemmataceae bacterium]